MSYNVRRQLTPLDIMPLSIPQLQERYALQSRQGIYNRIAHLESLGLQKDLEERSAFLQELDNLSLYLQQEGARMSGYSLSGQFARVFLRTSLDDELL